MREISFVKKLRFNFNGSVAKRALVIGDADNDIQNELVCASQQGDLGIFKGSDPECFAHARNLGMVTACIIGDLINSGKNYVTSINMEGWLFIFDVSVGDRVMRDSHKDEVNQTSKLSASVEIPTGNKESSTKVEGELEPFYEQRMPANCKELLIADLDGDGQNELIIGLTDRVLRTYKWVRIEHERGKFVGLYKWEFADQIGSVSLNPSVHENCQDIIVAQPGGTYAKLECFDKKPPLTGSNSMSGSLNEQRIDEPTTKSQLQYTVGSPMDDDNVKTEYVNKLTPEYHQLALSQMRNHHVSTEVLGGIKNGKDSQLYSLIVIATLDGTLMLVNKDEILWSLQVDHQLFALAVMEHNNPKPQQLVASQSTSTMILNSGYLNDPGTTEDESSKSQHFVVCAWNGKTYIIDEERNYLRFKFGEAVSAFTAGSYYFNDRHHASLIYATFNNQIILYYDVLPDSIKPMYLLKEIINNPEYVDVYEDLHKLVRMLDQTIVGPDEENEGVERADVHRDELALYEAIHEILYNFCET